MMVTYLLQDPTTQCFSLNPSQLFAAIKVVLLSRVNPRMPNRKEKAKETNRRKQEVLQAEGAD